MMSLKPIWEFKMTNLFFAIIGLIHLSHSQSENNSNIQKRFFSGSVWVTNNGISLVPSLSLEKPATIFNMSMGQGKLSFDPELRFSLEGKPWSFLFWWRYKLIHSGKFKFHIGTHPSFVFKNETVSINGASKNILITSRYWAGEFVPSYGIGEHTRLGIYYLYSRGLNDFATTDTHFLALNSDFSNIKLSDEFYLKFRPQFFYLKLDDRQGTYASSLLTLAKKKFPWSIAAITTKTINSTIKSKDFVWNVNLIYSY
ncbi:hypothetical protein [Aestuariivivens sediminicola]|uniref:hypothetical protein n=1 Tax=Aestuariivivens sediminicola TaxID=2913560 RepID=UPI001F56927A|nr:hypothetical protein [Aestuariivivens sediminicola]